MIYLFVGFSYLGFFFWIDQNESNDHSPHRGDRTKVIDCSSCFFAFP